eukprot:TRINITY_DN5886_c0_g2_i2.p1 TRINITY_DN5886_c0_g2~~TRINITY_DN5886_c0_g2_i2.p1  ORF type:complete len:249 (+),score=47.33 TRINITY_DN5886_c0_g2_i2:82-828(+)
MYSVSKVSLFLVSLPCLCLCMMDVNNGGGEVIRGLPCVKRLNQLFCPSAGNSYPDKAINTFIDDNKALLRRMYGELQEAQTVTRTTVRVVRTFNGVSRFRRDVLEGTFDEMVMPFHEEELLNKNDNSTLSREKRQAEFPGAPKDNNPNKMDVCESKIDVVTPYWSVNSNGKVRAILNNKEFEQAIHQEICTLPSTNRCNRDCSCEQKYKWHRLLAYDPNNDCAGIFMDWFLFPSCCVCRCAKNPFLTS